MRPSAGSQPTRALTLVLAQGVQGLRTLPFRLPFNRQTYARQARAFPLIQPRKLWPGDGDQGNRMTRGHFRFVGQQVDMADSTWYPVEVGPDWLERLHGFNWLDDLRASTDHQARTTARALTLRWIEDHGRYRPKSWGPVTLATRLTQWMAHFEFLQSPSAPTLQRTILMSTAQQYAYLNRVVPGRLQGSGLIRALKALIIVGLCLPGPQRAASRNRALKLLARALETQIAPDGSHVERCPQSHMRVLLDLLDIRAALTLAGLSPPDWLILALRNAAGSLRQLQHGDGRLARFQGEPLLSARLISEALERADGGQTPPTGSGGNSGFYRIKAGRSLLIVDAGTPTDQPGPQGVHASTLAFEFSIGQVHLVSNCGNFDLGHDWTQLQRTTAAHSTLVWADRNSAELLPDGHVGRAPTQVLARYSGDAAGSGLALSHNGYEEVSGGVHYRQLYLRHDGLVLEGEDRLEGADEALGTPLVRFHLHPGVNAEITQTRRNALLRISMRERGWRFETSGATLQLAESVVADAAGQPQRAQQLILAPAYEGLAPEDRAMRWRFIQEGTNS